MHSADGVFSKNVDKAAHRIRRPPCARHDRRQQAMPPRPRASRFSSPSTERSVGGAVQRWRSHCRHPERKQDRRSGTSADSPCVERLKTRQAPLARRRRTEKAVCRRQSRRWPVATVTTGSKNPFTRKLRRDDAILAEAKKSGCDLIVIGTNRRVGRVALSRPDGRACAQGLEGCGVLVAT